LRTSPERIRTWAYVPSRASSVAEVPAERTCAPLADLHLDAMDRGADRNVADRGVFGADVEPLTSVAPTSRPRGDDVSALVSVADQAMWAVRLGRTQCVRLWPEWRPCCA
jgi:hypothetical protein